MPALSDGSKEKERERERERIVVALREVPLPHWLEKNRIEKILSREVWFVCLLSEGRELLPKRASFAVLACTIPVLHLYARASQVSHVYTRLPKEASIAVRGSRAASQQTGIDREFSLRCLRVLERLSVLWLSRVRIERV